MPFRFTGRFDLAGTSRPPFDAFNLSHAVGDDPAAVACNRAALADWLGLPASGIAWMDQVHGCRVAVLAAPPEAAVPGTDGLVTAAAGLALGVLTADCLSVLLDGGDVVGAAHAGRRGVVASVVPNAVAAMRRLGAGGVRAHLGPAIGPCCYEVGPDVYDEVVARHPAAAARSRAGNDALDLRAAVRSQLADLQVTVADDVATCTACDPAYFSYRRDGVTGRQAGVIVR